VLRRGQDTAAVRFVAACTQAWSIERKEELLQLAQNWDGWDERQQGTDTNSLLTAHRETLF
jgi:hypothetical protein